MPRTRSSDYAGCSPELSKAAMKCMMISEVPAWTWKEMSAADRTRKVRQMGQLAEQSGFLGVTPRMK
jgi:hypothetical protein